MHLAQRERGVGQELQHLLARHDVERLRGKRQVLSVRDTEIGDIAQPGELEVAAREPNRRF